jgi:phosphonate transport system substrate-binding protein
MVRWYHPTLGMRVVWVFLTSTIVAAFAIVPQSFASQNTLLGNHQQAAKVGQSVKKELTMGVFPHLPPRDLEKVYAPLAALFSDVLGRKVHFSSSSSYKKFMAKLDQQAFDIVMVQPFDYVHIADKFGYLPIATRDEPLSTIVVVPEDSHLTNLRSLIGGKVALPPEVAAVSKLFKAELKENHLQPGKDIQLLYYRSHVSCMQQVLIGAADACATAAPALRFFSSKMKVKLRIIARSRKIPHSLFAVRPELSPSDREKILRVLQSLSSNEVGRKLLKRGKLTPFIPINDTAYDVVRHFSVEN